MTALATRTRKEENACPQRLRAAEGRCARSAVDNSRPGARAYVSHPRPRARDFDRPGKKTVEAMNMRKRQRAGAEGDGTLSVGRGLRDGRQRVSHYAAPVSPKHASSQNLPRYSPFRIIIRIIIRDSSSPANCGIPGLTRLVRDDSPRLTYLSAISTMVMVRWVRVPHRRKT